VNVRKGTAPKVPPPPRRFWRLLGNATKAGVGLALVLGTAAATAWGGYRLALTSSRFSVQNL